MLLVICILFLAYNVRNAYSQQQEMCIRDSLQPEANMETGAISSKIERGKHTTRHTELFPVDADSYIMDTPGFSSLYVNDFEKEELKYYFPEFAAYEGTCKFNGCDHIHEPVSYTHLSCHGHWGAAG